MEVGVIVAALVSGILGGVGGGMGAEWLRSKGVREQRNVDDHGARAESYTQLLRAHDTLIATDARRVGQSEWLALKSRLVECAAKVTVIGTVEASAAAEELNEAWMDPDHDHFEAARAALIEAARHDAAPGKTP